MNQIVQRVGRVLRKVEGKETALVYVIYVSDSKDDNVLKCVKSAIDTAAGKTGTLKYSAGTVQNSGPTVSD
jgi:superfamily II DNA or RNA helicase